MFWECFVLIFFGTALLQNFLIRALAIVPSGKGGYEQLHRFPLLKDIGKPKGEGRQFLLYGEHDKKTLNKPRKWKGGGKITEFRRGLGPGSEEEYDYFYEYESSDYRKASRSFLSGENQKTMSSKSNREIFTCPDGYNGTYPMGESCDEYLICVSGQPFSHTCSEGLAFDLISKRCDFSVNSACNYACPAKNGYFWIPGDCTGFFRCKDGRPRYETCPSRRHWDFAREICVDREVSSCPMKCSTAEGVQPYDGDCESYIVCQGKEPLYRRCPQGERFDPEKLVCVSKMLKSCKNSDRDFPQRRIYLKYP